MNFNRREALLNSGVFIAVGTVISGSGALASSDQQIAISRSNASKLIGSWTGPYQFTGGSLKGNTGSSVLEIGSVDGTTIELTREWRWAGGGYDKFPLNGTQSASITVDGSISIKRAGELTLFKVGDSEYELRGEFSLDPGPAMHVYRRSNLTI